MSQEGTLSTYLFYFELQGDCLDTFRTQIFTGCAVLWWEILCWAVWFGCRDGIKLWKVLGFIRVCRSCPLEDKFASSSYKELTAYGALVYVRVGLLIVEQQQQQQSVAVRIYIEHVFLTRPLITKHESNSRLYFTIVELLPFQQLMVIQNNKQDLVNVIKQFNMFKLP